jgi:hypothetical protein
MRNKYVKIDIKLKHNSINIVAYRVRHNELMEPTGLTPQVGR